MHASLIFLLSSYQGSIFRSENKIYSPLPPSSENDIFPPSHDALFFNSHRGLFALILPYFAFILPFYFPFSHFLSPFFLFLLYFPPFSLRLFIFFPQMTSADIPPPRGGGYFPIYRPLLHIFSFQITLAVTPPPPPPGVGMVPDSYDGRKSCGFFRSILTRGFLVSDIFFSVKCRGEGLI